jgi:uncharacterized glyoxalase superfamily protein PhnB
MAADITPVLHYADLEKGLAFLTEAFGFTEHMLHRDPQGNLQYSEMTFEGCTVGIGPSAGTEGSPWELGPTAIYVALDGSPDELHDRAKAAGAEIVMGLTDQEYGSREFAARDLEGNVWCFGTYRPGVSHPAG